MLYSLFDIQAIGLVIDLEFNLDFILLFHQVYRTSCDQLIINLNLINFACLRKNTKFMVYVLYVM